MAKRTKVLKWSASSHWAERAIGLTGDTVTLIKRLVKISRDTVIRPQEIYATFGITDDPIDELALFMIVPIDPSLLPLSLPTDELVEHFLETALWVDQELWRSIGTDAGPIKLDDEATTTALNEVYSDAAVQENTWLCAVVFSNTTSTISFIGHLDYDVEYRQVTYNNDGSEMVQGPHSLGGA